jgi:hypothetical protein
MIRCWRFFTIPGALFAGLMTAGPAGALPPSVKDQAQLFQAKTVEQANLEIKKIDAQFHQKLVIETYSRIPKSFLTTWLKKKPDFGEWAKKHAGRSGLYVLICTETAPADIRILARGDMQGVFPAEVCQKLQNQLGAALASGQNDQGLTEAVSSIWRNLNDNFSAPPTFPWPGVFGVLLPILGIWLGILLFRAIVLRSESRSATPLPADFANAGSLPVAWFSALANGRLRELFASRPGAVTPKKPSEARPSESPPEDLAALHTQAGADSFES